MMMSWFTRNAADHPGGTALILCFSLRTLALEDGARESVMNPSVVTTRLLTRSMNQGFSEDDQRHQLTPLK